VRAIARFAGFQPYLRRKVTLSIGLTQVDPAGGAALADADELADLALYRAKHMGSNTISRRWCMLRP